MSQKTPVIQWLPQQWSKPDTLSQREKMRLHGQALNRIVREIHRTSAKGRFRIAPELGGAQIQAVDGVLLQCVSDLAEAADCYSTSSMNEALPNRSSMELKLADCLVRVCDLAGELGLDLGGAVADRLAV